MAIDHLKILKEIWNSGKAKCPYCEKGYYIALPDYPLKKQKSFSCSVCKEKLDLHFKIS